MRASGAYRYWRGMVRAWHRAPALQLLLPTAIGIHLSCYMGHSRAAFGLLGCGLAMLAGSLVRGRRLALWHSQVAVAGGVWLVVMAIAMLRVELSPPSPHLRHTTQRADDPRIEATERLEAYGIEPEVRRLIGAIALGYTARDSETQAMRQSFAHSGAAHILAVSGYHLALVVGLCALVLGRVRRLRHGHALYSLGLVVLAWSYTALTGWSVPTARAALMLTLYLGSRLLGRPSVVPNILACSALLQLLYAPSLLYSRGMWLSYMAVLSIHLYGGRLYRSIGIVHQPWLAWVWGILSTTLAVQVLLLPLCMYLFGYVSWSFVFTALPMAILSALLIPLALLAYALDYCGLWLPLATDLINALGQGMLAMARYGASLAPLIHSTSLPLSGLVVAWLIALVPTLRTSTPPLLTDGRA